MESAAAVRPLTTERSDTPDHAPLRQLRAALQEVLRGKPEVVDFALTTVVAGGHLLIEDVPGVGKSTLAQALARGLGADFRRVQFTSDMLPADLLGASIWSQKNESFSFHPGPVFTQVLLADEINRAPPRTQCALLEAMAEHRVTVDGVSHPLPSPFIVLATQNPEDHAGTYPLPESQRDRFATRVHIGHPPAEDEAALLAETGVTPQQRLAQLGTTLEPGLLAAHQNAARQVFVHPDLARYGQALVQGTRDHDGVSLGISTRGALAWISVARAKAHLQGRSQLEVDDLQDCAVACLAHRIALGGQLGEHGHAACARIIEELVAETPVPR